MADDNVQVVYIPLEWISELIVHSEYLGLLLTYDTGQEITVDNKRMFRLTLPPILSARECYALFDLICNPTPGGARVHVLRMWNFIQRRSCIRYITFFVFFGMERLLRRITETAITISLERSAVFIAALIEHYGMTSKASGYTLDLVVRSLGYPGGTDRMLIKIRKKDGLLLSTKRLRNRVDPLGTFLIRIKRLD